MLDWTYIRKIQKKINHINMLKEIMRDHLNRCRETNIQYPLMMFKNLGY